MDFALGMVTIVALVMTVAMGVVTWRLVHEERQRSAARLAALTTELQRLRTTDPMPATHAAQAPSTPSVAARVPKTAPTTMATTLIDVPIRDEEEPGTGVVTTAGDLFGSAIESSSGWPHRLAALGLAGAVLVAVLAIAIMVSARQDSPDVETATARVPVELLALDHERHGAFLTISGSVRNPADSAAASPLTVLAMVFDDDGVMVASGRAPLKLGARPPGGELPFAISLPADRVSRYRISFVVDDVTVPHVDRRAVQTASGHPDSES